MIKSSNSSNNNDYNNNGNDSTPLCIQVYRT